MPEHSFKSLKIGDKGEEVKKLHEFLKSYGYMKSHKGKTLRYKIDSDKSIEQSEREDVFDINSAEAIRLYQEYNKLPITGILDEETFTLMSKPRCGVPDIVETKTDFAVTEPWSKTNLTYSFENFTSRLDQSVIKMIIEKMLQQWASVTPLRFCEVNSGGDIQVGWFVRDHGDGKSFDGPAGVFGHGFFPEDGRVHFDDDEGWSDENLPPVAIHEFGHALGMLHSNNPNTVMWGNYTGLTRLQPDDISGIQSLYGPLAPISIIEAIRTKGITIPASILEVVNSLGITPPISMKQLLCYLYK